VWYLRSNVCCDWIENGKKGVFIETPAKYKYKIMEDANMDILKSLIARCKCGLYLTVNAHRDNDQTAENYLEEILGDVGLSGLPDDVQQKMIELDSIIELQFYPDSPDESHTIYHYDIEMTLDDALLHFLDQEDKSG
jgi:hypothetical protein